MILFVLYNKWTERKKSTVTHTYLFSVDSIEANFSKFTLQHGSSWSGNLSFFF